MLASDTSVVVAPDWTLLRNAAQACPEISRISGRTIHLPQFNTAVYLGHLTPILIAGRRMYHMSDIEAFAKKWGERKKAAA